MLKNINLKVTDMDRMFDGISLTPKNTNLKIKE